MRSTSEVLEGNRVKLSVEVDEEELGKAVDETFRRLQKEVSVPGFRPGKVPRRLLEVRLGPQAIRAEVIRHALPDYYAQAVEEAALDTIAAPEIDITSGEDDGPLAFDAVVEVRPKVSIAGYEGLVVTVPPLEPTEAEIDARVDRLREQFAELSEVERPARDGDLVTVDVHGVRGGQIAEGLSADDFVYEVGTGGIAEGADEALRAKKAGDIIEIDAPNLQGGAGTLRLLVKQVREKVLPEANDEWASDASEFDTLEELRNDLASRLRSLKKLEGRLVMRERAVEALAELVADEMPPTLVAQAADQARDALSRRLAERGLTIEQYLEASGQPLEELTAEFERQAVSQVRADLALRALADAEGIKVDDQDLAAEIERLARQSNQDARVLATRLARSGGLEQLRSDVRNEKAVVWLTDSVDLVDEQGALMDRTLLLEAEGSEEEAELGDGANQAVGDEDGAESVVSDLEAVADSADYEADKEG
ncbi:MAG: trigger factor [Acidimicrobiales bacterium]|jgi:trigger factor